MFEKDLDYDPAIKLEPIDEFGALQKPRRNPLLYITVAGGVLLSITTVLTIVWKLTTLRHSRELAVIVATQRDPASLRQESVTAFGDYDATQERLKQRSSEETRERNEVLEFFHRLEACAAAHDNEEFQKLVDFDRQLKRVELTGGMRGWSDFKKRSARTEMKKSADVESFWIKITVAGILQPPDDPNSRVVYAYGCNTSGSERLEYRFWISRSEQTWKLYDWTRLDLGLSEAEKWGMYAQFVDSAQMKGFRRWNELIQESDTLVSSNDHQAAAEKLRMAEAQAVPEGFQGYRWVLTGHRWLSLREVTEAERCYQQVPRPDDTPGVYNGLMECARGRNSAKALKYADQYLSAVGPNVDSLQTKAHLLEELGRKAEATEEWKKMLRIDPDNSSALIAILSALPKDDKAVFEQQLDQLEEPVATVVEIAPSIGYRDHQRLLQLAAYLDRKAPTSSGAYYVKGLAQFLDGQYDEAAGLYRQAYEAEQDDAKRKQYVNAYVDAMIASGKVLEVWKTVPNPKDAFDNLFSSYDEGDVELTDEEYRQTVRLFREQFPNDLGGIYRSAELDISQEKYDDAQASLRQGLQLASASTDAEDAENYRVSIANALASTLSKQGKVKEAHETAGDQQAGFSSLVQSAIADERWDDVRQLLELERAKEPDGAKFHYAAAELAAHDKQWDNAIQHFQEYAKSPVKGASWMLKHRLRELYLESGRWLDYYKSAEDQSEAFNQLATRFVSDENWDALNTLVAEHQHQFADDIRITQYLAATAWAHEDYATYIQRAQQLVAYKGPHSIEGYEQRNIEDKLFSAMLRSKQFDAARQFAEVRQREKNDTEYLAFVSAAAGNWEEANRWARQAAVKNESAAVFYSSDDVGRAFVGPQFGDLQRDFPIGLPYAVSPTLAVFLLDQPLTIDADTITHAFKDIGGNAATPVRTVKSARKGVAGAFALSVGEGAVWIAIGNGKYFERPQLSGGGAAFRESLDNSKAWLIAGVAGWHESDRKQAEVIARRLAARLVDGHSAILWARGRESWSGFSLYRSSPELLTAWQSAGNLDAFKDQGRELIETGHSNIAANREFERQLHDAVRRFEASPGARFEVVTWLADDPAMDPIRLSVTAVRRSFGSLEFDGTLKSQSSLLPELREGLSMQLHASSIQAMRFNDEPAIYRRTDQ